jgi:peptide chain release factor 3
MVSGTFKRGMKLTPSGLGKPIAVHSPILFFAQDREIAHSAEAGDIIGIPNHGTLRVGDTLSERNDVRFTGLPNFAPEILQRVRVKDPLKAKHLKKALESLAEEGVTQLFRPDLGADFIVCSVGQLQLEVMADRLREEYQLDVIFEPSPFGEARWILGEKADLEDFISKHRSAMGTDIDEQPVYLARSSWDVGYATDRYPKVRFERSKERA